MKNDCFKKEKKQIKMLINYIALEMAVLEMIKDGEYVMQK